MEVAALASDTPLRGASASFSTGENQPPVTAQDLPRTFVHEVTPEFFDALRIPFVGGVTATDLVSYAGAVLALAATAAVACLIPAWRACRIPPAVVLRDE